MKKATFELISSLLKEIRDCNTAISILKKENERLKKEVHILTVTPKPSEPTKEDIEWAKRIKYPTSPYTKSGNCPHCGLIRFPPNTAYGYAGPVCMCTLL